MPTVRFAASAHGPATEADAPAGGPLLDVCDDARAPVELGCRSARCATCLVEVLAGADLLLAPDRDERDRLDRIAAPRAARLACRAALRAGPGLVSLRWIGPR